MKRSHPSLFPPLVCYLITSSDYYPAVRTGSSNTLFFSVVFFFFFFGGHLPQTSGFRSAKEILVVSFATQARAFILSDCNIFYTPWGGGGITAGSNAPGAFLVPIVLWCCIHQFIIHVWGSLQDSSKNMLSRLSSKSRDLLSHVISSFLQMLR